MSNKFRDLRLPWKRVDGEDPSGPASWNGIQTKDGYFVLRDGSDPRLPCRAYMDFIVEVVNSAYSTHRSPDKVAERLRRKCDQRIAWNEALVSAAKIVRKSGDAHAEETADAILAKMIDPRVRRR